MNSHRSPAQPTVVHKGEAGVRRLGDFGLDPELLTRAARAAELGRDACGPHHVPTYPGFRAWADGNQTLADALVPLGFTLKFDSNVPLLFHPGESMAITMIAGDARTGTDAPPSTKNARGPASARMIDIGLDLFAGTPFEPAPRAGTYDLWILLWYRWGDIIRLELSLPRGLSNAGEVESWIERIVVDRFTLKDDQTANEFPRGPEVDVPISRRSV
jgi:hypothetical protein